jgi:hypothetical protein
MAFSMRSPSLSGGVLALCMVCAVLVPTQGATLVPGAPSSAALTALSGSSVQLGWAPPATDGGAKVTSYKVEWDADPGRQEVQSFTTNTFTGPNEVATITTSATDVNEVQTVATSATATQEIQTIKTTANPFNLLSGTFTLKLDTTATGGSVQTSGIIAHNAGTAGDRSRMKEILEAMSNVDPGVTVGVSAVDSEGGYTWSVTFPESMGDVPQLTLGTNSLGGSGAAVTIATPTQGNILRGAFRLTYGTSTTKDIAYNALDVDVKNALEALPNVETVNVARTSSATHALPRYQRGYTWVVTFTSDVNSGTLALMTPTWAGTLLGAGARVDVTQTPAGNQLGGTFAVTVAGAASAAIPYNASPGAMKLALEAIGGDGRVGTVAVTRVGPDPELGYSWKVSFISKQGNMCGPNGGLTCTTDVTNLLGTGKAATIFVNRVGTAKEVQVIKVTETSAGTVPATIYFRLGFANHLGYQWTEQIAANPSSGVCMSTQREVQTITTTTTNVVSSQTTFRLTFEGKTTGLIYANPSNGDCTPVAASVKAELEKLAGVGTVTAVGDKNAGTAVATQVCQITATFDSLSGNRDPMTVTVGNAGPLAAATYGGDTVTIVTTKDGAVDAIKSALEKLTKVGTVSVAGAAVIGTTKEECKWTVTFDTNAGKLMPMTITTGSSTVGGAAIATPGTAGSSTPAATGSTTMAVLAGLANAAAGAEVGTCHGATCAIPGYLGGHFTVAYKGQITGYLRFDSTAAAIKAALEALSTVGTVDVARTVAADENLGFTWTVTFRTNLGDLEPLVVDYRALTGTVATASVQEVKKGVFPPFNSKDPAHGLALGSKTVTNLQDLSLVASSLKQGIPYYFRVSASNAVGTGLPMVSVPPFVAPMPQPPSAPQDVRLAVVDGKSLRVTTRAPLLDGGKAVDKYMVEYSNAKLQDEVQSVKLAVAVNSEVQTVTSSCAQTYEVQVIETVSTKGLAPSDVTEVQRVTCDALGGSFAITFNGRTTGAILASEASAAAIKSKLEELTTITSVAVTFFGGATTACANCGAGGCTGGFAVQFDSVPGISGDMPAMTTDVTLLTGNRRADVTTHAPGVAGLTGTFRLSYKGVTTADINYNDDAATMTTKLTSLSTIGAGGVAVVSAANTVGATKGTRAWKITFALALGGDVETIKVDPLNMKLQGNGADVKAYANGDPTPSTTYTPVRGNNIGGTFTLTLRGHTTSAISYKAADTTMKARLEELPNIGTVNVARTGPTSWGGYVWTVTFTSNPGAFPAGATNVAPLVPTWTNLLTGAATLTGTAATIAIATPSDGSDPLSGTFALGYADGGLVKTIDMPYDASALQVKSALEGLNNIGRVDVSRTTNPDGFTWLVTFNGCRTVLNVDVCNLGNIVSLDEYQTAEDKVKGGSAKPTITVAEVTPGSGPPNGWTQTITNLAGGEPYSLDIAGLQLGQPYYVRVYAHSAVSYGARALSFPEASTPSHQPAGAPAPVELVMSTGAADVGGPSISLSWGAPTVNGGAPIAGYELWMNGAAGGSWQMVFDGVDRPVRTSDTIYASDDGLGVEAGRQYRFKVRAITYCNPSKPKLVCNGAFSDERIYTVRAPRAPLAPPLPVRGSKTNLGSVAAGNAVISIAWQRPLDNGGAPIQKYELWMDAGAGNDHKLGVGDGSKNTQLSGDAAEASTSWTGSGNFVKVHQLACTETKIGNIGAAGTAGAAIDSQGTITTPEVLCAPENLKIASDSFKPTGANPIVARALNEGHVYKFYVVAVNSKGNSAQSPILSVVAAVLPDWNSVAAPVTLDDIFTTSADISRNLLATSAIGATATPSIGSQQVTSMKLSWQEPLNNGFAPITGYKLYQFKGIPKNTVADPYPVKQEQQQIVTYVDAIASEVQTVVITAQSGKIRLRIGSETTALVDIVSASTATDMQTALNALTGAAIGTGTTVTASNVVAGAYTTVTYTITIAGLPTGTTDKIVVLTDSLVSVTSTTVSQQVGSTNLGGTFTVAFRGAETVPLAHNIAAIGMKEALENLPTVGIATVDKVVNDPIKQTATWTVKFETEMGDLPSMVVTSGRLTGSPNARVSVVGTYGPGSAATLVWDGSRRPDIKQFTVTGLQPDALYAFKVVAINAVGDGRASAATPTIAARAGSSPSHTTVSGTTLAQGIAGVVYEQQTIACNPCTSTFTLKFGVGTATINLQASTTAAAFASALSTANTGIGAVAVTKSTPAGAGTATWTVTFTGKTGDLSLLTNPTKAVAGDGITVEEFIKGAANHFTIEPKKASGVVVKDVSAAANFEGRDIFFTELWTSPTTLLDGTHTWAKDGGVATYNKALFDIQTFTVTAFAGSAGTFKLSMDASLDPKLYTRHGKPINLLTPRKCCLAGAELKTGALNLGTLKAATHEVAAKTVKDALELLSNVQHVDVTRTVTNTNDHTYSITFSQDLGDRPELKLSDDVAVTGLVIAAGGTPIDELQKGVTEVQTITTSADKMFVREKQSITAYHTGACTGTFTLKLSGASAATAALAVNIKPCRHLDDGGDNTCSVSDTAAAGAASMESEIEKMSNVGRVRVTRAATAGAHLTCFSWTVEFIDPVGDLPELVVDKGNFVGTTLDVQEVVKGYSPLGGTFTVGFGTSTTGDLKFDSSAVEMKTALESLATIDEVDVTRIDLATGHRWTVSFTKNLGNLPALVASPYSYEEQTISTNGGNPTPIGGTFTLSFKGAAAGSMAATTGPLAYDITQQGMKAALEALSTVGTVDVNRDTYNFGKYSWRVTFRSNLGDLPLLTASHAGTLTGSSASVSVAEAKAGSSASLTGDTPAVTVREKVAGLPSYTGRYTPTTTGSYTLAVRQLERGGLQASYYDNQWLLQSPVITRIDPSINFDWGTGLITNFGRDYVSARWVGKLKPEYTETYTFYLYADDGVRMWLDHVKVIDSWQTTSVETRYSAALDASKYHDIRVEYKEHKGPAKVVLEWSSFSQAKEVVPADSLYYATHLVSSPFALNVVPGAADYPHTTAYGPGLVLKTDTVSTTCPAASATCVARPLAGEVQKFTIQAADQVGNHKTVGGDTFTVHLVGPATTGTFGAPVAGVFGLSTQLTPTYIGGGKYAVEYTPLQSGEYKVYVKAGGSAEFHTSETHYEGSSPGYGTDIYCAKGATAKCSPFDVTVLPGTTTRQTSTFSNFANLTKDGLSEAAAGDVSRFSIQAKDTYGNQRHEGGDAWSVVLKCTLGCGSASYRGNVVDRHNGKYAVDYTALTAGTYRLETTYQAQPALACPKLQGGVCMALDIYPTVTVVHGDLHGPSSTAVYTGSPTCTPRNPSGAPARSTCDGLKEAVTGLTSKFSVQGRDQFSNLRIGSGTPSCPACPSPGAGTCCYGNGKSDAFLVTLTGPGGYKVVTSTAVQNVEHPNNAVVPPIGGGYFTLKYGGKTTDRIPHDARASTVRTALEKAHGFLKKVEVSRTENGGKTTWSVTFTSHLKDWAADQLTVAGTDVAIQLKCDGGAATCTAGFRTGHTAKSGIYPVEYTLYKTGTYSMAVTTLDTGIHVTGSPFTVVNTDGDAHPSTSLATGKGLVAGVVGDEFKFQVQVKDVRAYEQQTVTVNAATAINGASTFRLSHGGKQTANIPFSATAADMKAKLEALPTVGAVTVFKDEIGLAGSKWPVWEINFNSPTTNPNPQLAPANEGNLPMMVPDGSLLALTVPDATALAPVVTVSEIMAGSSGNNRTDNADLSRIVVGFSSTSVDVGVKEIQEILCDASANSDKITFSFKGGAASAQIPVTATLAHVAATLNALVIAAGGLPANTVAVTVTNAGAGHQTSICGSSQVKGMPEPIHVTFDQVTSVNLAATGDMPQLVVVVAVGNSVVRVTEVQKGVAPSSKTVAIGMKEIQGITCTASALSAAPTLQLSMNGISSAQFAPNIDAAALKTVLESISTIGAGGIANIAMGGQATVCANSPGKIMVTFTKEGDHANFEVVSTGITESIVISEETKGIKSLKYAGGTSGLYDVVYRPTTKGLYTVQVTITDPLTSTNTVTHVLSDLSSGVTMLPALPSAPHSTHTARSVAMEGVIEKFTVQAKDEFLNDEDGSLPSGHTFLVSLAGAADSKGGLSGAATVVGTVTQASPNTDGRYFVQYPPVVAGAYTLSVRHRRSGGLLVTYFKSDDLTDPVLTARSICPAAVKRASGAAMTSCDASDVVPNIDYDWKFDSPLANHALQNTEDTKGAEYFPSDRFSVRWSGEILPAVTETFTFHADADDGVRVIVGGVTIIDKFTDTGASEVTGTAALVANTFTSIVVEYREGLGPAHCKLKWSSASTTKVTVPSSSFYYTRHLDNSPMDVTINPGTVDSDTTNAAGDGLSKAVALHMSSFVVQSKDTAGNNRYNSGTNDWVVRLTGTSGWAGTGRTNDYQSDMKSPHVYTPSNVCPACVKTLVGDVLTVDLDVVHQLVPGTQFTVSKGPIDWRNTPQTDCTFTVASTTMYTAGVGNTATITVVTGHGCTAFAGDARAIRSAVKRDWKYVGTATVTHGSRFITTAPSGTGAWTLPAGTGNALKRGDTIVVGDERFTVDTTLAPFNVASVPLSSPYMGKDATGVVVYKGGANSGTQLVNFVPQVEGTYRLDVMEPATKEVQRITTSVAAAGSLGGSFALTFTGLNVAGKSETKSTGPIPFNASPASVKSALELLSNIPAGSITVSHPNSATGCVGNGLSTCTWIITFTREQQYSCTRTMYGWDAVAASCPTATCSDGFRLRTTTCYKNSEGDLATMTAGTALLTGNDAKVAVTEQVKGRAETSIKGAPYSVVVAPADTDPASTTAYGQGLVFGTAGVASKFTIQAKDSHGNNRDDSQARNLFRVDAFMGSVPPEHAGAHVKGTVKYLADGKYEASFMPTRAGRHTVSVQMATAMETQQVWTTFETTAPCVLQMQAYTCTTADMQRRGGSWTLAYNGQTTEAIAWDASGAAVKTALEALSTVGTVDVVRKAGSLCVTTAPCVTVGANDEQRLGFQYTVTFTDEVGSLNAMVAANKLLPSNVGATANTNAVVTASGAGTTKGTLAHIKTKKTAGSITSTGCSVYGETLGNGVYGASTYTCQNLGKTWQAAVQRVAIAGTAMTNGQTFALSFNGHKTGAITFGNACSGAQADAEAKIKAKIDELVTVGSVSVTSVTRTPASCAFDVTFDSSGYREADAKNFGPLPKLSCITSTPHTLVATTTTVTTSTPGTSPFSTIIEPGAFSAAHTTAVQGGTVLVNGIQEPMIAKEQATFETNGYMTIQARDAFTNRYMRKPLDEVQVVATGCSAGAINGGTFTVSFGGETSQPIKWDATNAVVEAELEKLGSVGDVGVTSASNLVGGVGGKAYAVTFKSNEGDLGAVTANGALLTSDAGAATTTSATVTQCTKYKMQDITSADTAAGLGGTFTLSFHGVSTAQMQFDVSGADMKTELQKLADIHVATVVRGGASGNGYTWTVTLVAYEGSLERLYPEVQMLTGTAPTLTVKAMCPIYNVGASNFPTVAGTHGLHFVARLKGPATVAADVSFISSTNYPSLFAPVGSSVAVAACPNKPWEEWGSCMDGDGGRYLTKYVAPRVGNYKLYVSQATPGGLTGKYFNNRWLFGSPVSTRVDKTINFEWADYITETGKDFISVRWSGFVRPAFSEQYTFELRINDGARLWVDGVQLLDAWEDDLLTSASYKTHKVTTSVALVADRLYDILLEYRENKNHAVAKLLWQSASQPLVVIPSHHLFNVDTPIASADFSKAIVAADPNPLSSAELVAISTAGTSSPFAVVPEGVKPLQPTSLSLAIATDTAITVTFKPPTNDGGTVITKYNVEWWDKNSGYGVTEKQTLKVTATGGTFTLSWPAVGGEITRPLNFDINYVQLEAAIEALTDVGDVTVTLVSAGVYSIVFETNVIAAAYAGATGLDNLVVNYASLTGGTAGVCADTLTANVGFASALTCAGSDSRIATVKYCGTSPPTPLNCIMSSEATSLDVAAGAPYTYTIQAAHQVAGNSEGFSARAAAYNALGYGRPAAAVSLKPMAVPGTPTQVELVRVAGTSTQLRVYWTAGNDKSSAITDYKIETDTVPTFDSAGLITSTNAAATLKTACEREFKSLGCTTLPSQNCKPGWHEHVVTGLTMGTKYYVRVTAKNAMGYGDVGTSTPAFEIPRKTADRIAIDTGVILSTVPADTTTSVSDASTSLRITWHAPVSIQGSAVSKYVVEWFTAPPRQEVQMVRSSGAGLAGTFQLSYNGQTTDHLPFNINESDMKLALNGLSSLRHVTVTRAKNMAAPAVANNFDWSVTFIGDCPSCVGKKLVPVNEGLTGTGPLVSVFQDLLPGGAANRAGGVVTTTTGIMTLNSATCTLAANIAEGEYVRIESSASASGETFKAGNTAVAGTTVNLQDHRGMPATYKGATATKAAWIGTTPSGALAANLKSYEMTDVADGSPFSYVATSLTPGTLYSAQVSAFNDRGYNEPRLALPGALAPPKQKPDLPTQTSLIVNTASSLKVLWNHPASAGGDMITKYKVEWDSKASFDSGPAGAPIGVHNVILTTPATDCVTTPCSYVIASLVKGTAYFVRVFTYNSYGYSVRGASSSPASQVPKTQPAPPVSVAIAPASETSLKVTFAKSADNGGGLVTKYKVEWDAVGQDGFLAHSATEQSNGVALAGGLYSEHEVQTITAQAAGRDLGGTFRVGFKGHTTSDLAWDISADNMRLALQALAPVGTVSVTRKAHLKLDASSTLQQQGFVWTITFLTQAGDSTGSAVASITNKRSGDVEQLVVSSSKNTLFGTFAATSTAGDSLKGNTATVSTQTTVEGFAGFEQQTITTSTSHGDLGGSFKLTFDGKTTGPLAHDVAAADMKIALEGLGNAGSLDVKRNYRQIQNPTKGFVWTVIFKTLLGNVPDIVKDPVGSVELVAVCPAPTPCPSAVVLISTDQVTGTRPPMSSSLKNMMVLTGADIAGTSISYTIANLIKGAAYHVRVSAWNGVGDSYGKTMYSTPAIASPARKPEAPV